MTAMVKFIKCRSDESCYNLTSYLLGICVELGSNCFLFMLSKDKDFTKYIFQRHKDYVTRLFGEGIFDVLDSDYPMGVINYMANWFKALYVVAVDDGSNYHLFFIRAWSVVLNSILEGGDVLW